MSDKTRYIKPSDALEIYPELISKWNWTPQDIGFLVKVGAVKGTRSNNRNNNFVDIYSLQRFIQFVNDSKETDKVAIR